MLCERSYDPLSRMLLKGDEGGAKFGGGVAENGDFRQGGHYPWMILALRVTGALFHLLNVAVFKPSYLGRSNKLHVTLRCRVDYVQNGA
jgi:hypothetical protein